MSSAIEVLREYALALQEYREANKRLMQARDNMMVWLEDHPELLDPDYDPELGV